MPNFRISGSRRPPFIKIKNKQIGGLAAPLIDFRSDLSDDNMGAGLLRGALSDIGVRKFDRHDDIAEIWTGTIDKVIGQQLLVPKIILEYDLNMMEVPNLGIKAKLKEALAKLEILAKKVWDSLTDRVPNLPFSEFWVWIKGALGGIVGYFLNAANIVTDAVNAAAQTVWDHTIGPLVDCISALAKKIPSLIKRFYDAHVTKQSIEKTADCGEDYLITRQMWNHSKTNLYKQLAKEVHTAVLGAIKNIPLIGQVAGLVSSAVECIASILSKIYSWVILFVKTREANEYIIAGDRVNAVVHGPTILSAICYLTGEVNQRNEVRGVKNSAALESSAKLIVEQSPLALSTHAYSLLAAALNRDENLKYSNMI
jgi:hypothetical protein